MSSRYAPKPNPVERRKGESVRQNIFLTRHNADLSDRRSATLQNTYRSSRHYDGLASPRLHLRTTTN